MPLDVAETQADPGATVTVTTLEQRGTCPHCERDMPIVHDCRAAVVLSGYRSPLYDELYRDWYRVELTAHTGQARQRRRVEVLWSNRPFPHVTTPLFDLVEAS